MTVIHNGGTVPPPPGQLIISVLNRHKNRTSSTPYIPRHTGGTGCISHSGYGNTHGESTVRLPLLATIVSYRFRHIPFVSVNTHRYPWVSVLGLHSICTMWCGHHVFNEPTAYPDIDWIRIEEIFANISTKAMAFSIENPFLWLPFPLDTY
jgi:hypothetical protein